MLFLSRTYVLIISLFNAATFKKQIWININISTALSCTDEGLACPSGGCCGRDGNGNGPKAYCDEKFC